MLKIISREEIDGLVLDKLLGSGSTALVFEMTSGEAYKEYIRDFSIMGYDLVSFQNQGKSTGNIGHFLNLSNLSLKSFCTPTGIIVKDDLIEGITMRRAIGNQFCLRDYKLEDLLEHESEARKDIIELSKYFEMHDINEGSIFYDSSYGFSLVDLDFYTESSIDNSLNNLFMFYFRILEYIPAVKELIYDEFRKGIDYYRLEVAIEVINKYLKDNNLKENDIRKIRAMR